MIAACADNTRVSISTAMVLEKSNCKAQVSVIQQTCVTVHCVHWLVSSEHTGRG